MSIQDDSAYTYNSWSSLMVVDLKLKNGLSNVADFINSMLVDDSGKSLAIIVPTQFEAREFSMMVDVQLLVDEPISFNW